LATARNDHYQQWTKVVGYFLVANIRLFLNII
jgi:hypothetical protein